jgi:predicted RNA-binding protein
MKELIIEAILRLKVKGQFDIILKDIFEEIKLIKNEL